MTHEPTPEMIDAGAEVLWLQGQPGHREPKPWKGADPLVAELFREEAKAVWIAMAAADPSSGGRL